jgi:alpha-D-xyloside xylohydrolase
LWTYAQRIAVDGRPIQRALGLAHPELGEHPSDTYLLGDALLVAPVVERDAREREVIFPSGRWFDWWTGAPQDGAESGSRAVVAAPLDTLPLFLEESAFVVLLRPTIDTLSETIEPARVDSYATSPGVLWARIAPGAEPAEFTVFDGAALSYERTSGGFSLHSTDGTEFNGGVVFEIIALGARPAAVSLDGAALAERASLVELEGVGDGFAFDEAATGGTLFVKVGAGAHEVLATR